jgi:transposase
MRPSGSAAALEKRRRKAVELLQQGETVEAVAAAVKASVQSVRRWRVAYEQAGAEGLNSTPHPGRTPRLTKKQTERLAKILARGAKANGFQNDLWTCPRVLAVIEKQFGVTFHVDYIGTLLHKLGWSMQKPEQRARERDEVEIRRWRANEWPRIKKGARTSS